jgi:co-chaperonin GroES (HSP10)
MKNLQPINRRLLVEVSNNVLEDKAEAAFLVPDGFNKEPQVYTQYVVLGSSTDTQYDYPSGTFVVAMTHLAEVVEVAGETVTFIPESSVVCSFE